ncbi:MAG: hypothetical protein ACJ8FY_13770 [Gemmataceae bacterium]
MTTFRIAVCSYENGAPDKESTHVELTVNHDKNRKIAYLYVGPLQIADGWETRRITFGKSHLTLEPMPRLNRKRLDALLEQVKHQIADKTGPAWDLLEAVQAENGLIFCHYTYQSKLIDVC